MWETDHWESSVDSGVPRRDRRSGEYSRYVPAPLVGAPLRLDASLDELVATAERAVRAVTAEMGRDLAGISRFLLRSEAIASSRIEGIAPSAEQVALAELGQDEEVRGISDQAQLVANNVTVVREATTRLVRVDRVSVSDVVELHAALLPTEPRHHGIRTVQNWIGGSDWHPIDADFVPPDPGRLDGLLDDLMSYTNGAGHSPVVQAALVHAQFETLHPFTDGNGRIGRALIHTVLARRGLTTGAVLPISLVLSTLRDEYVRGLTTFRQVGATDDDETHRARAAWIATFARAVLEASGQARRLAIELSELREDWTRRLEAARSARGMNPNVRSDSATSLILHDLPASPVLTTRTVQRVRGVSNVAANKALDELREAGVLEARSVGPRRTAYLAVDVLDLITHTERRLASTRFDTRASTPNRPVPAWPAGRTQP
jgi:Fic family protein